MREGAGMTDELQGRRALVTGGTGALGRAVVERLLNAGAAVHCTWVDRKEADKMEAALGDRVRLHQADVTSEPAVTELFDALDRDGGVQVLANVVGGFFSGSLDETDGKTWSRMLAMNSTSAFLCSRAAAAHMRRGNWGRIINVAAAPALDHGAADMSAYAASKAAVLNLTESLAKELAADGITANAIVPSIIDTPANRKAMPDADRRTWLTPSEIAAVVAFLASDSAAIVTGTAVRLSRG